MDNLKGIPRSEKMITCSFAQLYGAFYHLSALLFWFTFTTLISIAPSHSRQLFSTKKAVKSTVPYLPSTKQKKLATSW